MPNQNQTVLALYNSLCDQQDALSTAIQATTDPNLAAKISAEIQEVAHRIILTQNLLFVVDSAQLTALAGQVNGSSKQLTTAIGQIQNTTAFLNTVAGYLSDVDQVIDLAKTLAKAF